MSMGAYRQVGDAVGGPGTARGLKRGGKREKTRRMFVSAPCYDPGPAADPALAQTGVLVPVAHQCTSSVCLAAAAKSASVTNA